MIPVDQLYNDPHRGDCMRATVASLLELELEQVPHFRLFDDGQWFDILVGYMKGCGYEYVAVGNPKQKKGLQLEDSIDGYFYAVVPSMNFENCFHAVVIDMNGIVVHDPSDTKLHMGRNVLQIIETYWFKFAKVEFEL